MGRLGATLDRLEAILGHLGTVLDGLGVSWSALGPSWSRLGALLLKMCVLPCEFDDMCRFCRCARRKRAIRPKVRAPPPSPGPLPRGLKPQRKTSSLVPRSFRYLGLHGTERAPQELAREGSHHPSCWSLGVQSFYVVFRIWSLGGAERAHITLRTGALASRDLYVVVRI